MIMDLDAYDRIACKAFFAGFFIGGAVVGMIFILILCNQP